MTEHCPDHSKLMQDVGAINSKVDTLVEGQKEFREAIESVKLQLNSQDKESAIDRIKIKPFLIAVGLVFAVVLTKIGEGLIEYVMKILRG